MDAVLHEERLDGRNKRLHPLPGRLPDGAIVAAGEAAYLAVGGRFRRWGPAGYGETEALPGGAWLLTPPAAFGVLAAGYRPLLHASATSG
jgi:hypothetical protein